MMLQINSFNSFLLWKSKQSNSFLKSAKKTAVRWIYPAGLACFFKLYIVVSHRRFTQMIDQIDLRNQAVESITFGNDCNLVFLE